MKRAAFFDFDGTLVPERNSLMWHFVRNLPSEDLRFEKGTAFVRAMSGLIPRAALSLLPTEVMYRELIRAVFRGLPVVAAHVAATRLVQYVEGSLFAPMRTVLDQHSADERYLVSANLEPVIEAFCERRGLHCIATRLVKRDGVYTGEVVGEVCKGEEKVRRLGQHLDGVDEVHAYGNSIEDLAMLRVANKAVLVNPSPQLSRVRELLLAPRIFVDRTPSAFSA